MMKTVKEIVKRERQKRRRRCGDYDRIDRFMCNSNFLWNQSLSQLQGRGILQECERKRNQSNSKKHNAQTRQISLHQSYQKENG